MSSVVLSRRRREPQHAVLWGSFRSCCAVRHRPDREWARLTRAARCGHLQVSSMRRRSPRDQTFAAVRHNGRSPRPRRGRSGREHPRESYLPVVSKQSSLGAAGSLLHRGLHPPRGSTMGDFDPLRLSVRGTDSGSRSRLRADRHKPSRAGFRPLAVLRRNLDVEPS